MTTELYDVDYKKYGLLAMFAFTMVASSAAAPLTAEIGAFLSGTQTYTVDNATYQGTVQTQNVDIKKPQPSFLSSVFSRDIERDETFYLPGDRVEVCADVKYENDDLSDGTWVYGHNMYGVFTELPLETEKELGTGSPADGDSVRLIEGRYTEICHQFDAPSQNGDQDMNMFVYPGGGLGTYLGQVTIPVVADSDGDGVRDNTDDCPNEAGIEDKDGCPNSPPRMGQIQVPRDIKAGEPFTVTVSVSDPDGDNVEIEWSNGDSGTSARYTFDESGSHVISVEADDGYEDVEKETNIVVDQPQAPQPPSPIEQLGSWFEGFVENFTGFDLFSAASSLDSYDAGENVQKNLRASADIRPDSIYSDGDVSYVYGRWAVVDKGEVVEQSGWQNLQEGEFQHNFDRSFSSTGEKAFVVVIAEAESTYNYDTDSWSDYKINVVDKEQYKFKVEGLVQPPSPIKNLIGFFQDFLGGIVDFLGVGS